GSRDDALLLHRRVDDRPRPPQAIPMVVGLSIHRLDPARCEPALSGGETGAAVVQAIDSVRRRASGRVPPHNLEAGESLLGAMLLSRDAITSAVEVRVESSDFYKPSHGHIYEAIQSLHGQGEPADPVTVAEELRRADLLDNIGGRATLLQIQANTPAS